MFKYVFVGCLVASMVLGSCVVFAESGMASRDKYIFGRLLSERASICTDYSRALTRGKEQLKKEGNIEYKIRNQILDLRAKRDRLETRILTIALRHGWDVPALDSQGPGVALDIREQELEKVFGVANILVKTELKKDAGVFAANLNLPVQHVTVK